MQDSGPRGPGLATPDVKHFVSIATEITSHQDSNQ